MIAQYLPNVLVQLVNEYYMRGEVDVIAALESTVPININKYKQFMTSVNNHNNYISKNESLEYVNLDPFESFDNVKWEIKDRWIFEYSKTGVYTRFLGIESGIPCAPRIEHCRIIIALEYDYLSGTFVPIVEINHISIRVSHCDCVNAYTKYGDINHGLVFNKRLSCLQPFSRRARGILKHQMMRSVSHSSDDDPWYEMFDKACDLANQMICDWQF